MRDYWLLRLISSVPEVDSRKRLQKTVYLLQHFGCPLKADYFLHYYGPFSREVASLTDRLVSSGLLKQEEDKERFRYQVSPEGKKALARFEASVHGKAALREIKPFILSFQKLNESDLWLLELASTILLFHKKLGDWEKAQAETAKFKGSLATKSNLAKARKLAKSFCGIDGSSGNPS